jgi:signal transduction histidine kinase
MFDDQVQGVFVVTVNMAERLEQVDAVVRVGALVYGSIFILASVVAWVAAGAVLRPLRDLSVTAQTITESDLSRRIDVDGDDEIAALARTFNGMLDRLEEAFETQRRFVDDASHELRTPITVIRGQLELLSDDPDERRATMAIVADELDRMSRIVEDLLVLAKSEQPDFVIPRPLDLVEFVESIVAKGNALGAGEVAVEEAPAAVVVADEQRLTQAMMNLVRNALEHTPDGTKVMVGGAREDDRLRLWVTDHGPGIPAAERAHIFDRFARGRAGRRSGEGAGLGLAIVRAIAEAHRGEVDLHSGEGGSTFIITIPQEVET